MHGSWGDADDSREVGTWLPWPYSRCCDLIADAVTLQQTLWPTPRRQGQLLSVSSSSLGNKTLDQVPRSLHIYSLRSSQTFVENSRVAVALTYLPFHQGKRHTEAERLPQSTHYPRADSTLIVWPVSLSVSQAFSLPFMRPSHLPSLLSWGLSTLSLYIPPGHAGLRSSPGILNPESFQIILTIFSLLFPSSRNVSSSCSTNFCCSLLFFSCSFLSSSNLLISWSCSSRLLLEEACSLFWENKRWAESQC